MTSKNKYEPPTQKQKFCLTENWTKNAFVSERILNLSIGKLKLMFLETKPGKQKVISTKCDHQASDLTAILKPDLLNSHSVTQFLCPFLCNVFAPVCPFQILGDF